MTTIVMNGIKGNIYVVQNITNETEEFLKDFLYCSDYLVRMGYESYFSKIQTDNENNLKTIFLTKEGEHFVKYSKLTDSNKSVKEKFLEICAELNEDEFFYRNEKVSLEIELDESYHPQIHDNGLHIITIGPKGGLHEVLEDTKHLTRSTSILEDNSYESYGEGDHLPDHADYLLFRD